jgi:3'-5' exoribonuclease
MIKDLQVGDVYDMNLAVKQSEIRKTRASKEYLYLVLTDGDADITANHWDWPHKNAPEANSVLHMTGSVTSFNNIKQLKVSTIERKPDMSALDFVKKAPVDLSILLEELARLSGSIENPNYKQMVVDQTSAPWFINCPGAIGVHHAYRHGLLEHSISVALLAEAIVDALQTMRNIRINRDVVIAGALLHDIGKTSAIHMDGLNIAYTTEGTLHEHIVLGQRIIYKYYNKMPNEVERITHIISSHHGELEFGSPVTPKFLEAFIINWADLADSRFNIICDINDGLESTISEKAWALNTRLLNQLEV